MQHSSFPLLNAQQMREAERATIRAGVMERTLMSRAGEQLAAVIISLFAPRFCVVMCGTGNNGNDGRIAATHLMDAGWRVRVATLDEPYEDDLNRAELVIDALLGLGLNKPPEGAMKQAIERINALCCPVIAVDIASGVDASTGQVAGIAVKATHTVTFAAAKIGHYLLPGKAHTGALHVMDVGIESRGIQAQSPVVFLNQAPTLPTFAMDAHKYTRGHVLVMGGDAQTSGAQILAATAAQRGGAGAVSILCTPDALEFYAHKPAEIMLKSADKLDHVYQLVHDKRVSALAFGMGAGALDATHKRMRVMVESGKPCVVDADALQPHIFDALHADCVLTPHAGEFKRMFGAFPCKISALRAATERTNAVIVYKGSDTVIAQQGRALVVNPNAPASLATAGSGDVLAGIIAGLLAQGLPAFEAACAGVWLHGEAGTKTGHNFTAGDLIRHVA